MFNNEDDSEKPVLKSIFIEVKQLYRQPSEFEDSQSPLFLHWILQINNTSILKDVCQ